MHKVTSCSRSDSTTPLQKPGSHAVQDGVSETSSALYEITFRTCWFLAGWCSFCHKPKAGILAFIPRTSFLIMAGIS